MAMFKPIDRIVIGFEMYGSGKGFRSAVAKRHNMSRRYAYTLLHDAERFIEKYKNTDIDPLSDVISVDKLHIDRTILSLACSCHASLEGICEHIKTMYNYSIDPSTVSRKLSYYGKKAHEFLETVDLSGIMTCAYDEVFQSGDLPILALICLDTHYIATMLCTEDRTAETWAILMLLLSENQGLDFMYGISDFGSGILAGIPQALPDAQMLGDVFHAIKEVGEQLQKIENLAFKRLESIAKLEMSVSGPRARKKTIEQLESERLVLDDYLLRADKAMTLLSWLKEMLAFPGYYLHEIKPLVLWILDEMDSIDGKTYDLHAKTTFMRKRLDSVLEFHSLFAKNMLILSEKNNIKPEILSLLYRQSAELNTSLVYRSISRRLTRYDSDEVNKARSLVSPLIKMTHRASSMIENTNSRIRKYVNAKHYLSNDFLALLQLYFNTKVIRRGDEIRKEKSPLELLTGDKRDFFEILGLKRPA